MSEQDQMPDRLGHYRLLDRIGEGGMGVVFLARDPGQRPVALKVLRPSVAGESTARRRLAREVETMRRVRSPHVAEVVDADLTGEMPYIVTRYVPGRTLDEVVAETGPLRGDPLARLACGLADALVAVHAAGVVHRDLKPGNVMLVNGSPVVIDFGIAQGADTTRLTMTGMFMGTPGYLSPEVIEGQPSSEASDVHAWAATMAFAATGRPPFGTGPYETIFYRIVNGQPDLAGVPPSLLPVLAAALSRDPSLRPSALTLSAQAAALDPAALVPPGPGSALAASAAGVGAAPPAWGGFGAGPNSPGTAGGAPQATRADLAQGGVEGSPGGARAAGLTPGGALPATAAADGVGLQPGAAASGGPLAAGGPPVAKVPAEGALAGGAIPGGAMPEGAGAEVAPIAGPPPAGAPPGSAPLDQGAPMPGGAWAGAPGNPGFAGVPGGGPPGGFGAAPVPADGGQPDPWAWQGGWSGPSPNAGWGVPVAADGLPGYGTRPISAARASDDYSDLLPPAQYQAPHQPFADAAGTGAVARATFAGDPAARESVSGRGQSVLVVAFMVLMAGVSVILPVLGTAAALALILSLRAGELSHTAAVRRRARGARGTAPFVTAVSFPWFLVRSVVACLILAPFALAAGAVAGGISIAAAPGQPLPRALAFAAGAFVAFYGIGPGSSRSRRQLGRLFGAAARTRFAGAVAITGMVVLAFAALAAAVTWPSLYWPAAPPARLSHIGVAPGGTWRHFGLVAHYLLAYLRGH